MMSRRTLLIVLGVSVALNMFFLGVLAARAWQRGTWQRSEWQGPPRARGAAAAGAERRGPGQGLGDPLRWLSDGERERLAPERQSLREQRHHVDELLRAEHYDGREFRSALEDLRAKTDKTQASLHEVLAQRADALSQPERQRLADSAWGKARSHGRHPGRD
jgi:uncharacterized membrane protein